MASASGPLLCFHCEEKARLEGDFLCRSCKEEYRKCYECGQRERNHPFKLCTVCYKAQRRMARAAASKSVAPPVLAPLPPVTPVVTAPSGTTGKLDHHRGSIIKQCTTEVFDINSHCSVHTLFNIIHMYTLILTTKYSSCHSESFPYNYINIICTCTHLAVLRIITIVMQVIVM